MDLESEKYYEFIKSRKSVRNFIYDKIEQQTIRNIIECGRWAPSGLNNQPWKVCMVEHPTVKRMLADLTKHGAIIDGAYINLVVFLDLEKGYDRVKDIQAIGAFMQNILLAVSATPKIGAVWLGEILNQKEKVNEIFKLSTDKFELMGVIAIGVIDEVREKQDDKPRERIALDEFTSLF